MQTRLITWNLVWVLVFWGSLGLRGQGVKRDRLSGLLSVTPVVERLDKHGFGAATFVSYRDSDLASPTFAIEMCVLEVPKGAGQLHVRDLRVSQNPVQVFQSAFPKATIGVMTGGYFGLDRRGAPIPLGLVKSAGKTTSPKHPWTSGGFVAKTADTVEIVPVSKFSDAGRYSDIVQSKPILVESGRDGIRSDTGERFDRSAVALDTTGSLYFFVIYEPGGGASSLAEFSNLIRSYRSSAGDQTIDFALAMDGGPGAHMYVPALRKHCGAGAPTFIPNALYVTK